MAAIIHILGSATNMYATYELFSRLYAVWDDQKWILRTLKVAHAVSCAASSIFSLYFLRTLPGSVTPYVELIDRACVMHELPWAQHCVWACEMAFDLFLIIMTLVNAADRPLRVSVSVVQSLLERGSFVYFVMFLFRLGNLGFSTFYHPGYFIMIQMLSYSITSVLVIRLIINVERIMQQGKHVNGKDDNVKEGSVSPPQFDEQETYTV
ncbi:hypothetical protein OF83DRAFT_1174823 [Amylostereum chailletii]|nr:hypothetical protein OF83DRAFT_1174823 [Amylostereum chailletii]